MLTSAVGLVVCALVVVLLTQLDGGRPANSPRAGTVPSSAAALPVPLQKPDLLAPLTGADDPLPSRSGLVKVLGPLTPGLGGSVGLAVVDASDGTLLYDVDAGTGRTPASTTKILTAAAALSVLGPQATLNTRVVTGSKRGQIVLLGGGDPTLTKENAGTATYPTPASLSTLAARTAATLKQHGTTLVHVDYDNGLFTGPVLAPGWTTDYITPGRAVVGPVSALAVDPGVIGSSGEPTWSATPGLNAALQFANLLEERGIDVRGEPLQTRAPHAATKLASVASPPLSALVERMLTTSDNDLAEALARQVAIAGGKQATFAGGAAAVTQAVGKLGVDLSGLLLYDGSGLSHRNRIPPRVLADVLVAAGKRPGLRAVLTGLPVAGFSGTLGDRAAVSDPTGSSAELDSAGVVRAKTGTLNGVSALAGVVTDEDGRLLVFAVLADQVYSRDRAERSLDRIAAELASCGCR